MISNEIEVKLVLDQAQLKGPTALQLAEMFKQIAGNEAFGNAVEEVFRDRSSFVSDIKGLMDVPDRGELDDYKQDWINSRDLEINVDNQIETWINNSELYYMPDTVTDIQNILEEYNFEQMQDDLNRDEEAIDDLKERVLTLEGSTEDLEEVDNSQANRLRTLEEDNLNERLEKVEEEAGLDWRTEFGDRLDTIEDKLGTDWSEEDNREISRLQERVDKLEEINKRLFHIIHNIQGVPLV